MQSLRGLHGLVIALVVGLSTECQAQFSGYGYQEYSRPLRGYAQPSNSVRPSSSGIRHQSYSTSGRTVYGPSYGTTYSRPISYVNRHVGTYSSRRSGSYQTLQNASPGRYYTWATAPGTSSRGYVAMDGSRWRLMKSSGIVEVDRYGQRHRQSYETSHHPQQYVWKIERASNPTRQAWISRDDKGRVTFLYNRPAYKHRGQFYPARVQLEGARVVRVRWESTPPWASQVHLAQGTSGPKLPSGSYRVTARNYLPATAADLVAAQQASGTHNVAARSRLRSRNYDEVPQFSNSVLQPQNSSSLSFTVSE